MYEFRIRGTIGDGAKIVEGYGSIYTMFNRTNNDQLYSNTTHDSHQAMTKPVTGESNGSWCLNSIQ